MPKLNDEQMPVSEPVTAEDETAALRRRCEELEKQYRILNSRFSRLITLYNFVVDKFVQGDQNN